MARSNTRLGPRLAAELEFQSASVKLWIRGLDFDLQSWPCDELQLGVEAGSHPKFGAIHGARPKNAATISALFPG